MSNNAHLYVFKISKYYNSSEFITHIKTVAYACHYTKINKIINYGYTNENVFILQEEVNSLCSNLSSFYVVVEINYMQKQTVKELTDITTPVRHQIMAI